MTKAPGIGGVQQLHHLHVQRAHRQRFAQQRIDIGRICGKKRSDTVEFGAHRSFLLAEYPGVFAIGGRAFQPVKHQIAQAGDARAVAVREAQD
jgi:hypothetical protein